MQFEEDVLHATGSVGVSMSNILLAAVEASYRLLKTAYWGKLQGN